MHKIIYEGQEYTTREAIETANKNCFTKIVSNTMYIEYLLTNYSFEVNYEEFNKISDSLTLQNTYINLLKKDTIFTKVMTDLISKTIDENKTKDTISMDKLIDIAVKFFAVYKLSDEGYYCGKLCSGINFIKKTEIKLMPNVEAFCFSAIWNNYEGGKYDLHNEFVNNIRELYKINLGIDKNEELLRAQGAMFFLMRNNENLKKMLLSEYEMNKEFLPFIIKDL
jgi:hypothetical protein